MDEPDVVQNINEDPPETPSELTCPVCERIIPSPAPDTCPHCQAPIHSILGLLRSSDMSLEEAVRDLKIGNISSAEKRLESVRITSKKHRAHVEVIRAMIERLQTRPGDALARLAAVEESLSDDDKDRRLDLLISHLRARCLQEQDALASCCEHYNYALFEAKRGHFEESRRSLIKALNETPWHSESHALMGKVLLALREEDDARYHLKRALASDPSNPTASKLLSTLSGKDSQAGDTFFGKIVTLFNESPAWTGSILVLIILVVIAVTALMNK